MQNEQKYIVTKHARERYAERIMNRNGLDIQRYANENELKIQNDISKLIEYGEEIYQGILTEKNFVRVYLNGLWVVLLDKAGEKVITLYKIDFGLDDAFNQEFVSRMLQKISSSKAKYEEESRKFEERNKEYKQIVADNEEQINKYRWIIKNLEKTNDGYKAVINNGDTDVREAEEQLRKAVMDLVCKKEF